MIPEPTGHETVTGENLGENLEQTDQNLDSNDKYFMQQGGFPFLVGTGGNLGADSARIRSPDAWILLGFATARSRCTGSVHHHTKLATCPLSPRTGGQDGPLPSMTALTASPTAATGSSTPAPPSSSDAPQAARSSAPVAGPSTGLFAPSNAVQLPVGSLHHPVTRFSKASESLRYLWMVLFVMAS